MLDWLQERLTAAIRGDIAAIFQILGALNVGWLSLKGILLAIQALKILYQEITGGLDANAARGRRQRMNTLGNEVQATAAALLSLENKKVAVVKSGGEVAKALLTAARQQAA